MSKSTRAIARRRKRSKLSKHQRSKLGTQHFGDKYVYKGKLLRRGQEKKEHIK